MKEINPNQLKAELKQFTCTEQYYYNPLFPKHRYTDGVKFLAEKAGAYWLLDFIFGYSDETELKDQPFQVWKLKVNDNRSASITVEDGNDTVLKSFKIPFTDFPLQEMDLWLIDKVLILPSEY